MKNTKGLSKFDNPLNPSPSEGCARLPFSHIMKINRSSPDCIGSTVYLLDNKGKRLAACIWRLMFRRWYFANVDLLWNIRVRRVLHAKRYTVYVNNVAGLKKQSVQKYDLYHLPVCVKVLGRFSCWSFLLHIFCFCVSSCYTENKAEQLLIVLIVLNTQSFSQPG